MEDLIMNNDYLSSSLEDKIDRLETEIEKLLTSSDQKEDIKKIYREIAELKPSKNPRIVRFQDLTILILSNMLAWFETNILSLNYALIVDLYILLEYVYYQINLSKSMLDLFQTIYKLDIPTPSHTITIQSFNSALPKFFCKLKDYKVAREGDSLFDNIKSCDDWNESSYSFWE